MQSVKHLPLTATSWQLEDQPLFFTVVLRGLSAEAFLARLCETL